MRDGLTKGQKTHNRIIEVSSKLFAEKGYDSVGLIEIGKNIGIKHTAILYHFKNKKGLLNAIFEEISNRFDTILKKYISSELNSLEIIRLQLDVNLEWLKKFNDDTRLSILLYYKATNDIDFSNMYGEIVYNSRKRYQKYILKALNNGEINTKIDPNILAEMLHEFLIGILINVISMNKNSESDVKQLKKKWEIFLSSILSCNLD